MISTSPHISALLGLTLLARAAGAPQGPQEFTIVPSKPTTLQAPKLSVMDVGYVPQLHDLRDRQLPLETTLAIAASQHAIAQYFIKRTNSVIVIEGLTEKWERTKLVAEPLRYETIRDVRKAFTNGIPASFERLNAEQRDLLATVHALPILMYLGTIETLYPSLTPDEGVVATKATKIIEAYCSKTGKDPWDSFAYRFFTITFRDVALGQALFRAHHEATTLNRPLDLVYGVGHLKTFPPELERLIRFQVPPEFQSFVAVHGNILDLRTVLEKDRSRPFAEQFERAVKEIGEMAKAI